jgi:DNA polymerase II small subunit/DNA polymerase delta subunit B
LLPHSARFSTLNLVPNPHQFVLKSTEGSSVREVRVLGHSGQPVEDILRQTYKNTIDETNEEVIVENENIEALKRTFYWKHLCPTAPGNLTI